MINSIRVLTTIFVAIFLSNQVIAREIPNITIGTIFPLSGPQAPYGKEALKGIDLALETFKIDNGELATHIKIIKADDKSNSEESGKVATDLLKSKRAHVLFGSITTSSTLAVAKIADKMGRPLISPIATSASFTAFKNVFATSIDEKTQGTLLASFAIKELKLKRAAILSSSIKTNSALAKSFKRKFTALGGRIVAEEIFPIGSIEFTPQLEALKKKNPSVILSTASSMNAGLIMKQAKKLGLNSRFLGGDTWDSANLARVAAGASAGAFFVNHFTTSNPEDHVKEFTTAFKKRYKRSPGVIAALSYDGMMIVLEAYKRTHSTLKSALIRSISRTKDYKGVTGNISMTSAGKPIKSGVIMETTKKSRRFRAMISP